MSRCAGCGHEIEEEGAKFCPQCGLAVGEPGAVPQAQTQAGAEKATAKPEDGLDQAETLQRDKADSAAEYLRAASAAAADGVLDDELDRKELDELRRKLRLTEQEAAALEEEAKNVHAGHLGRPEGGGESPGVPLALEINDNHFFMEQYVGVLEFRLHNASEEAIRNVCLSLEGNFLTSHEKCFRKIGPDKSKSYRIEVVPSLAGEHLVNVVLAYDADDGPVVYAAQPALKVLAKNAVPSNIKIEVDQSVHAEPGSKLGFGLSMRNEVDDVFERGIIGDVNDLISQSFPDRWAPVRLVYDEELTTHRREAIKPAVAVVPELAGRRTRTRKLSLGTSAEAGERRVLLLAQERVRMGRSRSNDISLRVLPRSERNDPLSLQITASKPHCFLSLRRDGLFLADNDTLNGTVLNGQPVQGEALVALDRPSDVDVAKALRLRLAPFLESEGAPHVAPELYEDLGEPDPLWRVAEELHLCCLLIQRVDSLADAEAYAIVYRWANAGLGPDDALVIPKEPLSPAVFRILRLGGGFWLEGLVEDEPPALDGVSVSRGQACPLAPGMSLSCRGMSLRIGEFAQLGF